MKCVYLVRSARDPRRRYVGVTSDPQARLAEHNGGDCRHTSKYRPWRIVVSIGFEEEAQALEFERYLKSGSGRAFALRHLW